MLINNYAGFWIRFFATVVDALVLLLFSSLAWFYLYGSEYFAVTDGPSVDSFSMTSESFVINIVCPLLFSIVFWFFKSATPGKIMFNLVIVDAVTLKKPSVKQFIIRYFAYFISAIFFLLGYFWVAIDKRKQGWHDKLSDTVVIKQTADEKQS